MVVNFLNFILVQKWQKNAFFLQMHSKKSVWYADIPSIITYNFAEDIISMKENRRTRIRGRDQPITPEFLDIRSSVGTVRKMPFFGHITSTYYKILTR